MEFYNIGKEIKKLRKENNLTQIELAQKVNITRQTLSKLENGLITRISLQVFLKILDILNYEIIITEKKPFYYFDIEQLD
jgi:transcriptional regulator with XRE-family HTH domain